MREQLTEVVAFQQLTENAVGFLEDVGFSGDEVRGLKPGAFICRNLRSGREARGKVF